MSRSDAQIAAMLYSGPRKSPRLNHPLFLERREPTLAGGNLKPGSARKIAQYEATANVHAKRANVTKKTAIPPKSARREINDLADLENFMASDDEEDVGNGVQDEAELLSSQEKEKSHGQSSLLSNEEFKDLINKCLVDGKLPKLTFRTELLEVEKGKLVKDVVIKAMNGGNLLACTDIDVHTKKATYLQQYLLNLVQMAYFSGVHGKFLFDPKQSKEQSLKPVESHVTALMKLCMITKFNLRELDAADSKLIRSAFESLGYKGRSKNNAEKIAQLAKLPEFDKIVEFVKQKASLGELKKLQEIVGEEIANKEQE